MGHYTIRTNDDEDQAIKKAQEATGQASASKTFMTAIPGFSVTETRWRSYGVNWRRKSASQELVSSVKQFRSSLNNLFDLADNPK